MLVDFSSILATIDSMEAMSLLRTEYKELGDRRSLNARWGTWWKAFDK